MTNRQLLTAPEVSKIFFHNKIKTGKVYELARTGEIPSVRIGERKILFCLQDLEAWWDKQINQQQKNNSHLKAVR